MIERLTQDSTEPVKSSARPAFELFAISFLILFLELSCIRWFGSTVIFLTFFTNLILMACFLGMTVGCLAAPRKFDLVNAVIPLLLLAVGLSLGVLWIYLTQEKVMIDFGSQEAPEQIFFGTESRQKDPTSFIVPIEVVAGTFFVLIAVTFVGLGQALGRRFNAVPNRVFAYTMDVLGSLCGIAAFSAASYARLPPIVWFSASGVLCLGFVTRRRWLQAGTLAVLLGLLAGADYLMNPASRTVWSTYYKVQHQRNNSDIYVNNILHQYMVETSNFASPYALPHLLNRDSGGKPFQNVLIIGAGSGNDVSAALQGGASHVDAVEIDPRILEIGREAHPERPYDDPRVTPHLDDGRSFLHKGNEQYDLIIFALVDSLVLHSGYSSLRLESFLFTEQSFRDIKARLKPGGVFAMYNLYRQGWVVGRLDLMAEKVFGSKPVVISMPYKEQIAPGDPQGIHTTFLLVGNTEATAVDAIRSKFNRNRFFWLNRGDRSNDGINGFGPAPPLSQGSRQWQQIGMAQVDTRGISQIPTDDWPFLYLREPRIPALNLRGIILVAVLSLVILFAFAPIRKFRPDGTMFFLGAGFMLLETKGVVHMALLFGSTWLVNSIVFFAILVMILASNLYVMGFRPKKLIPYYGLLLLALGVNALVPMDTFLALSGTLRIVVSCLVVFLPIFFAGVIFAITFRDREHPDMAFGSNIGGVILGGLSENLSLVLGFDHLLFISIGFYVLSALLIAKRART
jgi:spermidine synthase